MGSQMQNKTISEKIPETSSPETHYRPLEPSRIEEIEETRNEPRLTSRMVKDIDYTPQLLQQIEF